MSDVPYEELKRVVAELGLSGDDVALLLDCYATGLAEIEPHAEHEISMATIIGLNIKDILENGE
jgi:hypothetical protein